MSVPVPANVRVPDVRGIFSVDDFPAYLQTAGVSRIVYVRITIRPDSTIQSCVAEVSSGDTKLDAYTCAIIQKRAKFLPATWTDGSPTYGVIRVPVSWLIAYAPMSEEDTLRSTVPDLDLSVDRLPKGARKIVGVNVVIAADENGHAVSCMENPTPGSNSKRHFPELVSIACQQVAAKWTAVPPIDTTGKAARSIQTVSVHMKLDR
ncbi:MAG: energy transducer TonB [Alphaproteobacteria bacterium]|nr:energy transducer TonB [Alphaproteobacteria bacterium]